MFRSLLKHTGLWSDGMRRTQRCLFLLSSLILQENAFIASLRLYQELTIHIGSLPWRITDGQKSEVLSGESNNCADEGMESVSVRGPHSEGTKK